MTKIIWQKDVFRIIERPDELYRIEDLKGDCFDPSIHDDIDVEELKKQELSFENKVFNEGVFGYVLEKWNPEVDKGWETIESCWGFVGAFNDQLNNHYIVNELMIASLDYDN